MATYTKQKNGKIRVQVRRSGLYRGATFKTKKEAVRWAAAIENQASQLSVSGVVAPPRGTTLGHLIAKYLETSASSGGRTKRLTLAMLNRRLGHIPLVTFGAVHLREFIDVREASGAGGVTIAADLSFLSGVLKWAYFSRNLDVPYDLALAARASLRHRKNLITRSRERDREPTDVELQMLCDHWQGSQRMQIDMPSVVSFALRTGMRLGEICRITIEDIDFDERTVIIRDRKDPTRKAGNDQVVPVLPQAWAMLTERCAAMEQSRGRVFPYNPSCVSSAFTRACRRLGVDDLRFHDLRHRATADFFRSGLDIPFVAIMTGHKTWAMLRRYTCIRPSDVHAAYREKNAA